MLVQAMTEIGDFINYDEEWWHFTLNDQPFPDTPFDFPVC
jgi:D-alanyl-D-alanine dipeptidase